MALVLAIQACLGVFADMAQSHTWSALSVYGDAVGILGVGVAITIAWLTRMAMTEKPMSPDRPLDRAFMLLALSWVANSAAVASMDLNDASRVGVCFRLLAYQVSLAAALHFLAVATGCHARGLKGLVWGQLAVTSALVLWGYGEPTPSDEVFVLWQLVNVAGLVAVFLWLSRTWSIHSDRANWVLMAACLMGFCLWLSDMASAGRSVRMLTAMHHVFGAYLMLVWLLLTHRLERLPVTRSELRALTGPHAPPGDSPSDELDRLNTPEGRWPDQPDVLVSRRRIAQELHDGIGSQLVSLLASLDRSVPQQRSMANALEQCLLDLKVLVDDIDHTHECVLDALARLRYRMQASLDRLGIRLHWDLRDDPALMQVCGERSRQLLRIAQESLANVMRHACAKNLYVCCCFNKRSDSLVLDIADDGVGFKAGSHLACGKGLHGMRTRAQSIRADLVIRSVPGAGTTVRVVMPLCEHRPQTQTQAQAPRPVPPPDPPRPAC